MTGVTRADGAEEGKGGEKGERGEEEEEVKLLRTGRDEEKRIL